MIISLRGTMGSGKTWVAKRLIERYDGQPYALTERGRPKGYICKLSNGETLGIVGDYTKACGGCDTIQPYDDIWPRVEEMNTYCDHLLFEGALVSSGYGRIGVASEVFGDDFVFAFLDTPIEQCVKNVLGRRAARGNTKPFNDRNIRHKYRAVELSIRNIGVKHHRRVIILNHKKAVAEIVGLLLTGKEPCQSPLLTGKTLRTGKSSSSATSNGGTRSMTLTTATTAKRSLAK